MSKDIGMGVCKGTMVSFVPALFGCFLGIPSLLCLLFFCDFSTWNALYHKSELLKVMGYQKHRLPQAVFNCEYLITHTT